MNRILKTILIGLLAAAVVFPLASCKKYEIRDVDPEVPGRVRALGPESQDVNQLADQMMRSLMQTPALANAEEPPTVVMLPMKNNTRHAFNGEVFTSLLKSELNKKANGQILFAARDALPDVMEEREGKREGRLDYDPEMRARTIAGADYFLSGRADGLATASKKGQSDFIVYTFKLVDAETTIELWEDNFQTKKEGKDDVLYR